MRDAEAAASKAAAELAARQQQRVAEIAAALEEEDKEYRKQLKRQDYGRHVSGVCHVYMVALLVFITSSKLTSVELHCF